MSETRHRSGEIEHAIEEMVEQRIKRGTKRFGYVMAAAINGVMLWIAHQLLDWKWPAFLTPEFDDVLPIITVSFVVSIVANLAYALKDGWPTKPVGELVTSVIGFVTALRFWQVFPFEFSGDDWTWLVRLVLVVAMVGSAMGAIVQLVNLAKGVPPKIDP
jgi:hypothetical protein